MPFFCWNDIINTVFHKFLWKTRNGGAQNASAIIEGKEHYPMNQHNGLRRKLEKYAIPNLTLYLIICYGIGYLMQYLVPAGYQYLMLDRSSC